MPFRMVAMANKYPYVNEDAETNWRVGNSNDEMEQYTAWTFVKTEKLLEKIDMCKVNDITFKKQESTSLPLVDFSNSSYSTVKEK